MSKVLEVNIKTPRLERKDFEGVEEVRLSGGAISLDLSHSLHTALSMGVIVRAVDEDARKAMNTIFTGAA